MISLIACSIHSITRLSNPKFNHYLSRLDYLALRVRNKYVLFKVLEKAVFVYCRVTRVFFVHSAARITVVLRQFNVCLQLISFNSICFRGSLFSHLYMLKGAWTFYTRNVSIIQFVWSYTSTVEEARPYYDKTLIHHLIATKIPSRRNHEERLQPLSPRRSAAHDGPHP
jgi:hypothetical protein